MEKAFESDLGKGDRKYETPGAPGVGITKLAARKSLDKRSSRILLKTKCLMKMNRERSKTGNGGKRERAAEMPLL